jgi:hypothetical protein
MGRFTTLRKIMDQVTEKNVRIKLNCDERDNADGKFADNFKLIQNFLDNTLHMHDLINDTKFPYQLQSDLLVDMGWRGWWLVEMSTNVPDKVQALIDLREAWERMVAKSVSRPA